MERSKPISAPIRFGAAACLLVWLLGFSVAVIAQVCSCCDSSNNACTGCADKAVVCGGSGAHSSGCGAADSAGGCCDHNKSQPQHSCNSASACSTAAVELKPALPIALCDGFALSVAPCAKLIAAAERPAPAISISTSRTDADPAIPPELRLGSALWSHAPPIGLA